MGFVEVCTKGRPWVLQECVPRADLGFLMYLYSKGEPWVCRALDQGRVCPGFCQAYGAVSRLTEDGPWILMSLVCNASVVLLHTWHSPWVACTGGVMTYFCIRASYKVAHTGDIMV